MAPLGILGQVQASTGIAVEVGANLIERQKMATSFSVTPGMNAGQLAGACNQWAAYNGGDTPQNRQAANDMLANLGYTQDQINAGYQNYLASHTVNGSAPTYTAPAAQIS